MQTWGWCRNHTIVGLLFDFFATHKLAYLRNEEVYDSPRFLKELNQDPSLDVDPDDRSFHIFLKVAAVTIKQMRAEEDTKGIRNLISRLTPNHNRQLPKDESLHQRDLASLRNHHDLLCTLFWAAPEEERPQLHLIQDLVHVESAHREALLINLRAWQYLSRFVLASATTPAPYKPFGKWLHESFTKLHAQFSSVEIVVREQFIQLPTATKQLITEETIEQTIQANRKQLAMSIKQQLESLLGLLRQQPTLSAMSTVFNDSQTASKLPAAHVMRCIDTYLVTLATAVRNFRPYFGIEIEVTEQCLKIVTIYTTELIKEAKGWAESDPRSRIYGGLDVDMQLLGNDYCKVSCLDIRRLSLS
jgi:hypothetical protein